MYRAKTHRSGVATYDEAQDGNAWDRLATVEALRGSLREDSPTAGSLTLALQPIVDQGEVLPVALEALVRWIHPVRGQVPPDEFLPPAERAGLMPALTRRVIDLALTEATRLRSWGWDLPISVNVSASDLLDLSLVDYIAAALEAEGLPGTVLRVEITESLLVDRDRSAPFLARLMGLGISIAVDDYGTGYSSLAYLHDLPVSHLKIDRTFTQRLGDAKTSVIVGSTIEMAHRLGFQVVAEGVETEEQLGWLRSHGCDLIQGYLTGRPMDTPTLKQWLARLSQPAPFAR